MRKLIAAVLVAVLFAAPALATTYYVSTSGSDANNGTSAGTAWQTVGWANGNVASGDKVIVADGAYGHAPNPNVSGTSWTSRITYVGNLANPSAVQVPGTTLSRNFVTVKGFHFQTDLSINGDKDSVAYCILGGQRPQINGADDSMLANCTINSHRFWFMGAESDSSIKSYRDTIRDCTFNLNPTSWGGHTVRFKTLEAPIVERARFFVNLAPTAGDASFTKFFWVKNGKFIDCIWACTNNVLPGSPQDEPGWWVLRDVVQQNLFQRDTIWLWGPGKVQMLAGASGSYGQSVMNNNWEHCNIASYGTGPYDQVMFYQDGVRWDTLSYCVIAGATQGAIGFAAMRGPTVVDHCTLVGMTPWRGAFGLDTGPWVGTLYATNNIYYTGPNAPAQKEYSPLFTNMTSVTGHLTSNYNLFWTPRGTNYSIFAHGLGIGNSAPGVGKPWHTAISQDANSLFGDPFFKTVPQATGSGGTSGRFVLPADTPPGSGAGGAAIVVGFDVRLQAGSAAIGRGSGGSDIGAMPYGAAPAPVFTSDKVPPGYVTDFAVNTTTHVATFTAPVYPTKTRRTTRGDLVPDGCAVDATRKVELERYQVWGRPNATSPFYRLLSEGLARGLEGLVVSAPLPADMTGSWTMYSRLQSRLGLWDVCRTNVTATFP